MVKCGCANEGQNGACKREKVKLWSAALEQGRESVAFRHYPAPTEDQGLSRFFEAKHGPAGRAALAQLVRALDCGSRGPRSIRGGGTTSRTGLLPG